MRWQSGSVDTAFARTKRHWIRVNRRPLESGVALLPSLPAALHIAPGSLKYQDWPVEWRRNYSRGAAALHGRRAFPAARCCRDEEH